MTTIEHIQTYGSYILFGASTLIHSAANVASWVMGAVVDIAKSERMQRLALDMLWLHSRAMVQLENMGKWAYREFESVKYCVDKIQLFNGKLRDFTSRAKREPVATRWIQTCKLNKIPPAPDRFFENYQILSEEDDYSVAFSNASQSISNNTMRENGIIVMKNNDWYAVRLCSSVDIPTVLSGTTSGFRPMSISYSHPELPESIEIQLHEGFWCIGNELFSPAFMRRYLEYQELAFICDEQYSIQIIDSNVNVYNVKPNQYIRVDNENISILIFEEQESEAKVKEEEGEAKVEEEESEARVKEEESEAKVEEESEAEEVEEEIEEAESEEDASANVEAESEEDVSANVEAESEEDVVNVEAESEDEELVA